MNEVKSVSTVTKAIGDTCGEVNQSLRSESLGFVSPTPVMTVYVPP